MSCICYDTLKGKKIADIRTNTPHKPVCKFLSVCLDNSIQFFLMLTLKISSGKSCVRSKKQHKHQTENSEVINVTQQSVRINHLFLVKSTTKYCYLSIDNVTRVILYFILASNHRFSTDSLHYSHIMLFLGHRRLIRNITAVCIPSM